MKQLLRYLFKNKLLFILFLILAPITAVLEIGLAYAMELAVDYATSGRLDEFWIYALGFITYILVFFLVDYTYRKIRFKLIAKSMTLLKSDMDRHIMNLSYKYFTMNNVSQYMNHMTTNMEVMRNSFFNTILGLYIQILELVIAAIAMFYLSPLLGVYVVVLAFLQLLMPHLFSDAIEAKGKKAAVTQNEYLHVLKENYDSFLTSKVFGITDKLLQRGEEKNVSVEDSKFNSRKINSLSYECSFAIGNVMFLGIYLIGAFLALKSQLSIAAIIGASQLMVYIASPLNSISEIVAELKSVKKISDDYVEILSQQNEADGVNEKKEFHTGIEVSDLSFGYDEKKVIDHFSYSFEKGQKYLIVGPSGRGKSTLLNLIGRLMENYSGQICLDDSEIRDIKRQDYAKLVCYITQNPYIYEGTLRDNVRLFSDASDEEIATALKAAGLEPFLKNHEDGLDFRIEENAENISGGEKQRISIARALLRKAPILLMDEVTSALDYDTKVDIENTIFELQDVTVLYIAHSITENIRTKADEILSMEG